MNSPRHQEADTEQRLGELVLAYRLFAALRWGDTDDGHISARDPLRDDCFWMLASGVPFHRAEVEDLVLVGPNGDVLEGKGRRNDTGYYIHHPVHAAREDVVSVAHVHTQWGTPFSASVQLLEPITQESCIFFENHALFDDEEVQILSPRGGARIAVALGQHGAAILRNHGLLTTGGSVAEAVGLFVLMERAAEAHLKARQPQPISNEAARTAKDDLLASNVARAAFRALVQRHCGV